MSVETEIWTNQAGSLTSLPLGGGWDDEGDALVKDGGGWLLTVTVPEEADPSEAPPEFEAARLGLRHRVVVSLEPAAAPPEGTAALETAVEAIGASWGGVTWDVRSGRVRTWP